MAWLALDASTEACAVGVQNDDGEVFDAFELAPRKHSELLPKMLDSVLADSKLKKQAIEGCIVGIGPGAFTGIRIGVATAQGIALGLNIPCFAVSSLHAIAQQATISAPFSGSVMACIDARMDEVYCAEYTVSSSQITTLVGEELLLANSAFRLPDGCERVVGSGVACIDKVSASHIKTQVDCYPSAKALFQIHAQSSLVAIKPEQLMPCYIRNQVTYQNTKKA